MSSSATRGPILIVEDDKKTASLVQLYLEREGFETVLAHDGHEALELARRHRPIFIILDLMLPLVDGWEVCRELRRSSDVPILMLTARGEEVDRISGLTLGADDYVVKPFSPRELVARVKAVLRRGRLRSTVEKDILSHGGLALDPEKRKVSLNLMASPGRVFTRDELLDHLYPSGEAVIDRVIDVHIGKLRQKIEEDQANPRFILTVRGIGYQFEESSGS
jgi:DNA-binding response OmpR family regulator